MKPGPWLLQEIQLQRTPSEPIILSEALPIPQILGIFRNESLLHPFSYTGAARMSNVRGEIALWSYTVADISMETVLLTGDALMLKDNSS